jgi:sugar/nucleoside kinase (ribokinase family)
MAENIGDQTTPKVTVIGGTVIDITLSVPKSFLHHQQNFDELELPFGAKLSADSYLLNPGGSGANVAIGLKRLGMNVTLSSAVSTDELGKLLEEKLAEELTEMDMTHFDTPSPLSIILSVEAERTIVTVHNAREEDLRKPLPRDGHIHVGPLSGGNSEAFYQKIVSHIIQTDQTLSLNPSMFVIEGRERAFLSAVRASAILVVNQLEGARLARLSPKTPVEEIITNLKRLTDGVVCLTCGEHGAYVGSNEDKRIWFARATAPKSERVNATGAGDAFTTAFMARFLLAERAELLEDKIVDALKWAMLNSGSVVAHLGAQTGLLTRDKIEKDLKTISVTIK